MRNFFIVLLIILASNVTEAQNALPYVDYIDYYRENVKSTILFKEGNFLKDGKYKFTGSPNDFKFLLSYVLRYNINDFKPSDTITYEGEIKDSLKVNIWHLIINRGGKSINLIYHKDKESTLEGVDFSSSGNKYGLENEIIRLNGYDKNGYLDFIRVGGVIVSHYDFGNVDYYITKDEYYTDSKNRFYSNFNIINKNDSKIIYYETLSHIIKVLDKKKRFYNKESYFQYNDSCSLEIKTEMMTLKDDRKINKYIYENIDYTEIRKNKLTGDMVIPGKSKYIKINVTEAINGDKLVKLQFDFQNKEIKCPFTDFLKTNYYPIILYDKTYLIH